MKLEKFKEKNNKKIGIILFTITCVLLISGVILYRTFAIFETNDNLDLINGSVEDRGDIEFAFYVDNELVKDINEIPNKDSNYSLDTSSSYCKDVLNNTKISNVNWNEEKWGIELNNVSTTKTKCYLYFKQIYKEGILNGAIPDLGNGRLIPITISDNEKPSDVNYEGSTPGGKVTKADITTSWYSYEQKKWANAVILKDGERDHYKPGDEIQESVIESYFVWIPRYKYKLKESESTYNGYTTVEGTINVENVSKFYEKYPNQASSNAFEIIFETKDKGVQRGTSKGEYLTHPAFVAFDSDGMWVSKFETGYNQNSKNDDVTPDINTWNTTGAERNENNSAKVIIKPNVYSWRGIQVANAFYTSYNYQRELESHMMKNTEWGAVAYLTQSKYGLCDKDNKNCSEVRINNSESYITGMSATFDPSCGFTGTKESCNWYETTALNIDGDQIQSYYNKGSTVASTTENYYGVFDMVGGAWEYIMGVIQAADTNTSAPASGKSKINNSGFTGPYSCPTCDNQTDKENTTGEPWPSKKYYDLYDYRTTNVEYQRGILGDATKEIGPFYSVSYKKGETGTERYVSSYNVDLAAFVYSDYPWFGRGGSRHDGADVGVFAFNSLNGSATTDRSFRLVLMP